MPASTPNQAPALAPLIAHNREAWNRQAAADCEWSRPVSPQEIAAARRGELLPRLTPAPLPPHWLGPLAGLELLCLAGGGGQQGPLLAALGARVTVFDLSEGQLDRDRELAAREGLDLCCVQGDMADLGVFADASFDLIFHPISNLYVPDVRPVWRECARVLKSGGRLLASFYNPALFIDDRDVALKEQGLLRPAHRLPYADARDLPAEALAARRDRGEALVFGHSLTDLIGGQLAAGLQLLDLLEDWQPRPRLLIEGYVPGFMATLARKH